MRGFWLFVHFSGFVMWLGGGMASMIAGVSAKRFPPAERLAVYRAVAAVHSILIRSGAIAVVVSGIFLVLGMGGFGNLPPYINMMMANGILGAIVLGGFSVPTAIKLGALELDARGELPESFARLRKRQAVVATIAGLFGILALFGGTIIRAR